MQTADFETWAEAPGVEPPPLPEQIVPARYPEAGATVLALGPDAIFALKRNVFRSRDGGRSWEPLTTFKTLPVIGGGQHSVAVSHSDPDQIVVANDFGVWRSMDGGLTWCGLNQFLPNLPVRRVLSTPTGTAGTRIQVEGLPLLELPPGGAIWAPAAGVSLDADNALKERIQAVLGTAISAWAAADTRVYAGAADGRVWFSSDGGATFQVSTMPVGVTGPVERIYVDATAPRIALAAMAGDGIHVLRTFSGGSFWDAMDSNLPNAPAHSVAADRASGAVYVATDSGVFWTTTDLLNSAPAPRWNSISAGLPAGPAYDVRLDPAAVQLYAAVDGYGVYATAVPHRQPLRILNTADFSTRPAAPGSLMTVLGANVNTATGANQNYPVLGISSDAGSQIQVPFTAVGPMVELALGASAGLLSLPLQVQPVSPAIFLLSDGIAMLYDADAGLPIDGRNPAHSNGRVQIVATGLGRVRPDWPAGLPAPRLNPPAVVATVRAILDGAPLQVARATLAPDHVGLYLVEVQLPVVTNFGAAQLWVTADGQESNHVQILVEP